MFTAFFGGSGSYYNITQSKKVYTFPGGLLNNLVIRVSVLMRVCTVSYGFQVLDYISGPICCQVYVIRSTAKSPLCFGTAPRNPVFATTLNPKPETLNPKPSLSAQVRSPFSLEVLGCLCVDSTSPQIFNLSDLNQATFFLRLCVKSWATWASAVSNP